MAKSRILVVEDEKSHQLLISSALGSQFEIGLCASLYEAVNRLKQESFDLFLLDVMLPDGTGFDLCQKIRTEARYKFTPIIFLTSKQDVDSKVHGFALGGDDYVVKPCEPKELCARVQARIQREVDRESQPEVVHAHDLSLDLEKQRVKIVEGQEAGTTFDLTPLEFKLLLFLVRNEDRPVDRPTILANVWGQQTHVLERSVDTYVAALRRKLGTRGKYIRSVHGMGYRFSPGAVMSKKAA